MAVYEYMDAVLTELAVDAGVVLGARARVAVDVIVAGAPVQTRIDITLVELWKNHVLCSNSIIVCSR